jgi:predicted transcriptional regulator
MKISVNRENVKLLECLSSVTRLSVIELLGKQPMNIGDLAKTLGVSSAIMTRHMNLMEECGLIQTESIPGKRGLQKICRLAVNEITLSFKREEISGEFHHVSIPVGQYTAYEVHPTCGLASKDGFIGISDDPRYFSSPDRVNAAILWFQTGWVEYGIPSYMISSKSVQAIEISFEICSEFPKYKEDWPSDIHFYLNGMLLGVWLSPGDFGDKKGTFTPEWWRAGTQYGLLKTIRITKSGTILDGIHLSDTTLDQILTDPKKDLLFRIAVPDNTRHPGGINIFGRGFGNYDQNIEVRVEYY